MSTKENLHAGHRARMINKLLSDADLLSDHELLEIMLFPFIPRKNTNDIAHRLLLTFGSISKVFSATVQELMSVEGIGKHTATGILVNSKIMHKVFNSSKKSDTPKSSFVNVNNELVELFNGCIKEQTFVLLLDKNYRQITRLNFDNNELFNVKIDPKNLAYAFAINKPTHVIIAHNHLSGKAEPSNLDDLATARINELCKLHGVNLADHVIVSGKNTFSYFSSGRLADIKQKCSFDNYIQYLNQGDNL